jgi:hypothetical protein
MIIRLRNATNLGFQSHTRGSSADVVVESKVEEVVFTFYFVRKDEGFEILEEKPKNAEYGILHITLDPASMFGGPLVTFSDKESDVESAPELRGALLDLARRGAVASMAVELPEGNLIARDGIGDWTKLTNLSQRKSTYPEI